MEELVSKQMLRSAVRSVLNAWTALKMAAEDRLGGSNSLLNSYLLIDEIITIVHTEKDKISGYELADILHDYMDQKFNVICEDGSPEEVAEDILYFFSCYQLQDLDKFNCQLKKLLVVPEWLPNDCITTGFNGSTAVARTSPAVIENACDEPMDINIVEEPVKRNTQDEDGWTIVSKKNKSST